MHQYLSLEASAYDLPEITVGGVVDGIDGGREDYSHSGGVSRLCIWYSSAAHISLRQGYRDV